MPALVIRVDFTDDSDFDFTRVKLVGVVEDQVEEFKEDGRIDGIVEVSWDTED